MANGDNVIVKSVVRGDSIPSRSVAGAQSDMRLSHYGELMVNPVGKGAYAVANEGNYFVATNPTPGTGVAGIAAANGFDDTEALLFMRNDATSASGKKIYLDYIKLHCTAAGTNGTDFAYAMKLDTGTTRYASGGSAITPVNPNMQGANALDATMYFGAVVPGAATSNARLVAGQVIRPVIKVIGDTYTFDFGGDMKGGSGMPVEGTTILNAVIPCPPVVLGANDQFLLHEFATSQSVAASYEFEVGFWMR